MANTILSYTTHRPWPLPARKWSWRQSWCDLLFAHWPIPAASLRPLVPEQLAIQQFDGTAWISIIPFRMRGVAKRGWPPLPWFSAFPELNVRTYVELDGKPGIWFFSLDAARRAAVFVARRFFGLPYFHARIAVEVSGDGLRYQSRRLPVAASDRAAPWSLPLEHAPANLSVRYRAVSAPYEALPGGLEQWLVERYRLYSRDRSGVIHSADVHHLPWRLQRAEADFTANTMLDPLGLTLPSEPPLLHFAGQLDVVMWPLERYADRTKCLNTKLISAV
jgi:uncharacterized protein YqjF (DUF2071 family)